MTVVFSVYFAVEAYRWKMPGGALWGVATVVLTAGIVSPAYYLFFTFWVTGKDGKKRKPLKTPTLDYFIKVGRGEGGRGGRELVGLVCLFGVLVVRFFFFCISCRPAGFPNRAV